MDERILQRYCPADRGEVFDFVRATLPETASARIIAQWPWRYDANPFNPPEGPLVFLLRVGTQLVSLTAGFRLPTWVAGSVYQAENLGDWVVHRDYRRQRIWDGVDSGPIYRAPIAMAWGRSRSARIGKHTGWTPATMYSLVRVLDPAQIIDHFTRSRVLASLGGGIATATRAVAKPWRGASRDRSSAVAHLDEFDDRCDVLWQRSRHDDQAIVIRDRRYLQWRYRERPDANYVVFGFERGSELLGVLVARSGTHNGMRWGYLVDFLIAENENAILAALVEAALDEFRSGGAAAVSCYASDPRCRRALMLHGFVPVPQRDPIHFSLKIHPNWPELIGYGTLRHWYVTAGDGDLDMAF